MSRHSAASSAGRTRAAVPPLPRRVSGPAAAAKHEDGAPPRAPRAHIDSAALAYPDAAVAPRRARPLAPPRRRPAVAPRRRHARNGGVALAQRCASVAIDVSASRAMDRLVRSRVWIGVIAFALIGIVATQVSLLKLNSGIGRAVQTVSTLERSNASLRREVSRLSAGERIQPLAEAKGFVMPAPADVRYLDASGSTGAAAARAARRMGAPDPSATGLGTNAVVAGLTDASTQPANTAAAQPATTAPAAPDASVPATGTGAATAPVAPVAPAAPAAPAGGAPASVTTGPGSASSGGAAAQQATTAIP